MATVATAVSLPESEPVGNAGTTHGPPVPAAWGTASLPQPSAPSAVPPAQAPGAVWLRARLPLPLGIPRTPCVSCRRCLPPPAPSPPQRPQKKSPVDSGNGKRTGPRKGSRNWSELPIKEPPAAPRRPSMSPAELEKQIEHTTAKAEVPPSPCDLWQPTTRISVAPCSPKVVLKVVGCDHNGGQTNPTSND